jgi:hypothetical protein
MKRGDPEGFSESKVVLSGSNVSAYRDIEAQLTMTGSELLLRLHLLPDLYTDTCDSFAPLPMSIPDRWQSSDVPPPALPTSENPLQRVWLADDSRLVLLAGFVESMVRERA